MSAALGDWDELLEAFRESADVVRRGGGQRAVDRQHARGKLTARERIELLLDPATPFLELGLFAAFERFGSHGGAPAAGMVTGIGWVEGRPCMLVVNDATVKAGAFFPPTTKKLLRAQTVAGENRLPLIYLVDSAGVFLPLQDEIFPDQDDFGRIFYNNARLSAAGIPQLAAIMGSCVAGGAYLPVMCDKILMTEGSGLYIAGPALVKAAIGQRIESDELGGAKVHARLSGTIDFREADDESCLRHLRRLVATMGLPVAASAGPPAEADDRPATYENLPLEDAGRWPAAAILEAIVDADGAEVEPGPAGVVCARACIGGTPAAVVVPDGATDTVAPKAIHAVLEFLRRAEADGVRTVFVQGAQSWHSGSRDEVELIDYLATVEAPRLLLITGGVFEPGQRLPCGKSLRPRLVFAWPSAMARNWGEEDGESDIRRAEAWLGIDRILEPAATHRELAAAIGVLRV